MEREGIGMKKVTSVVFGSIVIAAVIGGFWLMVGMVVFA